MAHSLVLLLLHVLLLVLRLPLPVVVIVIVVVRLQDLLAQLLFTLVDIRVKLVSVLPDGELLVVIDRNVDLARADGLIVGIVELGNVGVAQSLLSGQSFIRVELKQILHEVKSIIASSREHISKSLVLGRWQRFKHSLCQVTVDSLNVFGEWASSDLHDSIELVQSGGTREHWLAEEKLSQDAAHTPHVYALGVLV